MLLAVTLPKMVINVMQTAKFVKNCKNINLFVDI